MPFPRELFKVGSLLSLRGTRSILAGRRYRALVGAIGLAYAVGAMVVGGMLYFPAHPLGTGWFFYIYPSGPGPSWIYPAILAGGPTFELVLPLVSGILMTLSSAGVGLGMALAVFLGARLIRQRRAGLLGPTAAGSFAGLTPAMIAFVTLGACCSTTAAATAGIGLAAQSTGTTTTAVLANAWYLGVFQVVVIYVALLAQEQLLRVYGRLWGSLSRDSPSPSASIDPSPAFGAREVGSAILRVALAAAGITWSLSVFTDWFPPLSGRSSAGTWFGGIFLHAVPGTFAVLVALFPAGVRAFWSRLPGAPSRLAIRGLLLGTGVALLTWIPAPLSRTGVVALGNELLGYAGFPASWGAVVPPALGPVGLALRWVFQFVLLGAVALAVGVAPEAALRPFLRSRAARTEKPELDLHREPSPLPAESG